MGGVNFKPNVPGAGQNPPGKVQGGQSDQGNADKANSHAPNRGGEAHGLARAEERIGARVGELAAQSQQIADKIKRGGHQNPHHKADSTADGNNARSGRADGQNNGHGGEHGRVKTGQGSEARSHESRGHESRSHESRGHDSHINESRGHKSHTHESRGRESRSSLTSNAVNYLRGAADAEALPPDVRRALDTLQTAVGRNELDALLNERGHKVEKLLDHFLRRAEHAYEHAGEHLTRHTGERPGRALGHVFHQVADELVNAVQVEKHFARLERIGGDPARRAEEAVLRLLFAPTEEGNGGSGHDRATRLTELWRDLRAGAFLPTQEAHSPFPLTGRARVVNEMIELLHTLDAIERAEAQLFPNGRAGAQSSQQQGALAETLAGRLANLTEAEFAELLNLLPTLPGRAGRNEMVRLLAALAGPLMDLDGRMILAKDGTPLKLDQLLWLSTAGGLLGASFKGDPFPVRLSPLIVFGFDALYSLIGFDGRTLAAPHYAAVQAQINGSELEWVCGQPPLTEGWMRALIERLKDSAVADQNLLGEMLEEALVDGRFHAVLVRGSVEEGEAVSGSFSVTRLLPEPGAAPDFAPGFAPA
ncbi:MAG TPA: hypothetical protein VGW12_15675 [Pyrinomonadaceae bacterium]|nr:hypothetical protein [Pyrinomonadaceae bacterium]